MVVVRRDRVARTRHYVMCPPRHFDVRYAINPWMDPTAGADADLALTQWEALRSLFTALGHRVQLLQPAVDLPDMVFAANGGLVIGDRMFGASFAYAERQPEAELHRRRFRDYLAAGGERPGGQALHTATHVNEGEGDFLVVGERVLAGWGFRTELAAHNEAADFFGREVVSLHLVDPRFYHLDVALAVLDDHTVAYYPGAFDRHSLLILQQLYPDAILATEADAAALGLNAVSDGLNVVLPPGADRLTGELRARGFHPIEIGLPELRKAGGSVKCCTMELHR